MTDDIVNSNGAISYMNSDEAFNLVKDEVNSALSASPRIIRGYTGHLTGSHGKFIRALSLITCARGRNGLVSSSAVKLAAAIEILHLATLVHDDVIDDADIRRGMPTLQKKYGKKTAVICGDYLLSIALRLAASTPDKKQYIDMDMPDYVVKICSGELFQHINNGNYNLSVYQYLKIISGKTAALFEASFFAGAIISGCGERETVLYRKMGHYLGMIFQLTDDCMDFEASENIAKKPVQSDFEKDVITLPIIHAFKKLAGLKEKAGSGSVTREELNEAVSKTDGLCFTRMVAKKYYNKYIDHMNKLDIAEEKRKDLTTILDKAFRVF